MPLELAKITESRLRALKPEETVFFFPVGGLEDHGPHLPLGLDLDEADRLCWLAGERLEKEMPGWNAVILPRAPLAVDSVTAVLRVTVRPYVLRDWLVDASISLARVGFRYFVCFTGGLGPRQITAIEEASRLLRWRSGGNFYQRLLRPSAHAVRLICASSALVSWKEVRRSPLWPDPVEHGGARDTSVALSLGSQEVDPLFKGLPEMPRGATFFERFSARLRGRTAGYWGNPAQATAEQGQATLDGAVSKVFPALRAVLDGANPTSLFYSRYTLFAPNRTFFKGWVISIGIFVLMMAWVFANIAALVGE